MKTSLLIAAILLMSSVFAQDRPEPANKHFGVALNSSWTNGLGSIGLTPSALYYQNKHQFELGFAIHPFNFEMYRRLGTEFNYKFFPNGLANRFNLYLVTNLAYTNSYVNFTWYYGDFTENRNHLSLTAGSGFQVKLFGKAYVGTSFSLGVMTFSSKIEQNGQPAPYGERMINNFSLDGAICVNVGYRF